MVDFEKYARERNDWVNGTGGAAQGGLTVLDAFAIEAMGALMQVYWEEPEAYETAGDLIKCHAEVAYDYAEAMLAERTKRETPKDVVQGVTGRTYG